MGEASGTFTGQAQTQAGQIPRTDAAEERAAQLHAHANFMRLARIPSTQRVNQHPMKEEEEIRD